MLRNTCKNREDFYTANYKTLSRDIKQDLNTWKNMP